MTVIKSEVIKSFTTTHSFVDQTVSTIVYVFFFLPLFQLETLNFDFQSSDYLQSNFPLGVDIYRHYTQSFFQSTNHLQPTIPSLCVYNSAAWLVCTIK